MVPSYYKKIKLYGFLFLPALSTLLFIILSAVNYPFPGVASFMPMFLTISVFYWVLYGPEFIPKWFVFFAGLFQDMIFGTPIGSSTVLNLILYGAVSSQQRFLIKEEFPFIWGIFIIAAAGMAFMNWVINMMYYSQFLFNDEMFIQLIFTILIYPLMHKFFSAVYSLILDSYY